MILCIYFLYFFKIRSKKCTKEYKLQYRFFVSWDDFLNKDFKVS